MYIASENQERVLALVYRSGDVSGLSTVRCYSRQGSAEVTTDFQERPNTDASIITFLPGEGEPTSFHVLDFREGLL